MGNLQRFAMGKVAKLNSLREISILMHGKKSEEKNQKVEPKQDRLGYRSATSLPAPKEFH